MRKLFWLFTVLALILSHVMCAHVALAYRGMVCATLHFGGSAPAEVAFLLVIPYAVGIAVCAILAAVFWEKSKR